MRVHGDVSPKEQRYWRLGCTRPTDIPDANEGTLTVNDQILQGCRSCELTWSRAQDLAIDPVFTHHERVTAIVVHIPLGLRHSDITKTCQLLSSVLQRLLGESAAVGVLHIVMARLSPTHRGHTNETYQEETVDETWHSIAPFLRLLGR